MSKEEVKRRKAPCRPALVSADHNHSELDEDRRLTGPKWREGSRENTFDHTRVLKTSPTPRERTTRKSAVLLGKVCLYFVGKFSRNKALTVLTCHQRFVFFRGKAVGCKRCRHSTMTSLGADESETSRYGKSFFYQLTSIQSPSD